jgi:hypothetical protein
MLPLEPLTLYDPPINQGTDTVPTPQPVRPLTEGQRAYEAKRAAKAGMSLEKWLDLKAKDAAAEAKAKAKAAEKAREASKPAKPPGFFGRLLERAQRPFGS